MLPRAASDCCWCRWRTPSVARVIGTVSSEDKARLAREAGADEVIVFTQQDFEAEVKRLTGGKGVDVVYDGVGKATFEKNLNVMRLRGMLVLYGMSSGPVPPVDPAKLSDKGSLYMARTTLAHFTATREELLARTGALFAHDRRRQTQSADCEDLSAGGSAASAPRHGIAKSGGEVAADSVEGRRLNQSQAGEILTVAIGIAGHQSIRF